MATKKVSLPEKVAVKVAQGQQNIQNIQAEAKRAIANEERHINSVLDVFADMSGLTIPENARVSFDFEGEHPSLVITTPEDADKNTGVSKAVEAEQTPEE